MSLVWPLSAIAFSIVGDDPVCSTSRITRVEEGPIFGILRSVPSGWRNDSIGSSRVRMAFAARLYPHMLCFDF